MSAAQTKQQIIESLKQGGWKVVVFDIDGTLLPKTSANAIIFKKLGKLETMLEYEAAYNQGRIGNDVVAVKLATHFAGKSKQELVDLLQLTDFIHDALDLTTQLRKSGIQLLVASVTWRFVAEWVAEQIGAEAVSGVVLEESQDVFTGKVSSHAHASHKTEGLEAWCKYMFHCPRGNQGSLAASGDE